MPLHVKRTAHINQVVGDFEAAKEFYSRIFGAEIFWEKYDEPARRDAAMFMIGDTPIELFAPVDDTSLLGAGLNTFGESFHSFEWLVDDLADAEDVFAAHGVRLTTHRPEQGFFMTHPKDGHGILFEIYNGTNTDEPRDRPDWSDAPWRNGPLALHRLNAMGVAVRDLESALAFFLSVSGGEIAYREHRAGIGHVAGVWVADMMTELIQPDSDDSPVADFITTMGPRIRSLDFKVADVDAVAAHFAGHGLRTARADCVADVLLDARDNFGVMYQFTERSLPSDPRD